MPVYYSDLSAKALVSNVRQEGANDPSSSFQSSPVGFENQSFSSQIANKIRCIPRFCKSKSTLTGTNVC